MWRVLSAFVLRPLVAVFAVALSIAFTASWLTLALPVHASSPLPTADEAARHPIGVRVVGGVGELFDRRTGVRFVIRGANYVFRETATDRRPPEIFRVGFYDPARVRTDFARLVAHGYNTVRVFLDHCDPQDAGCIGVVDGEGLNQAYLANVADLTEAAAEAGLQVLFTSNDLPDHGGYSDQANAASGSQFAGYRNAFYLTPEAIDATRRYWRDIITGLQGLGAPLEHVLAWELLNEQWMFTDQPPLSLREGEVTTTTGTYDMADAGQRTAMVADGIVYYVSQMREEILGLDRGALVTMGFFAADAAPGWYTDPVDALARSELDFLDFHAYPGAADMDKVASAFAISEYPQKPVVLGEYGAFRHSYSDIESASAAVAAWQVNTCRVGFDGWLYWAYTGADHTAADATWGLDDEDGYLLNLLAPDAHPDPCATIAVTRADKAIGARASASSVYGNERPRNAIDEDLDTAWSAGSHPEQWIRLDLARPTTVAEVQLLVSQKPAGRTSHVVEVLQKGRQGFHRIGQVKERTTDGDWLVVRPKRPVPDVRALRIRTVESPSWVAWREIRVFEEPRRRSGS